MNMKIIYKKKKLSSGPEQHVRTATVAKKPRASKLMFKLMRSNRQFLHS